MAGSGIKLWATGDTVSASNFQTFVQEQIIAVFDDSSDRDAAFGGAGEPTLAEGMCCYLKDTNEIQLYSGSAWVPLLDLDTWAVSSGAYTIKGDVTVGVDGTGHDVKFFGDTATHGYMLWDQSQDDLVFGGAVKVGIGSTGPSQKLLVYQAEGWDSTNFICLIENADSSADQGNVLQLKGGGTTSSSTSKMLDVLDISGSTEFFVRGDGLTFIRNADKAAGTFNIPHPVKGGDWRLRHSFVEAPRADLIYRGTVTLSGGTATIDLDVDSNMTDGTWEVLNGNPWAMVASSGNAVTWALSGKTLTINSETADAVCSWMVIGERQDPTIKDSKTLSFDSDGHLIVESEDPDMPGSASYGHVPSQNS